MLKVSYCHVFAGPRVWGSRERMDVFVRARLRCARLCFDFHFHGNAFNTLVVVLSYGLIGFYLICLALCRCIVDPRPLGDRLFALYILKTFLRNWLGMRTDVSDFVFISSAKYHSINWWFDSHSARQSCNVSPGLWCSCLSSRFEPVVDPWVLLWGNWFLWTTVYVPDNLRFCKIFFKMRKATYGTSFRESEQFSFESFKRRWKSNFLQGFIFLKTLVVKSLSRYRL